MKDGVMFTFLDATCKTNSPVTTSGSVDVFQVLSKVYDADSTSKATVSIGVDASSMQSSNVYDSGTNTASFCIRADLMGTQLDYDYSLFFQHALVEIKYNSDMTAITNLVINKHSTMQKIVAPEVEGCICDDVGECITT